MASIQKRENGYRAFICVQGKRESACFRTKKEALAWADLRSQELRTAHKRVANADYTFGETLEEYALKVTPQKRGHRWEEIRINSMLSSESFPRDLPLADLTPDVLAKWRDARLEQVSAGTVLREIGLLSSILETAKKEWRWISHNPMRDIRKPKSPDHREVLYTRDQIKKILKAMSYLPNGAIEFISQSVALCFLLALRTGMRAGEITGLTWDRVKDDYCVLPVTKTVPRNVPLTKKAKRIIEKMRGIDPVLVFSIDSRSLDANFRKYRDRAGIKGVTFHDSRHYAATQLSKKLDVLSLCRMFGWSNTKQALTYFNAHASDIAKRLDG